jgi:CBS domain containing-hemolysin-like protein
MSAFFLVPVLALAASPEVAEPRFVLLKLATLGLLVLFNAFFVAGEFALVRIRTSQLDTLVEKGDTRAAKARGMVDQLESYLSTTQLGITLSTLGLGWLGSPFLAQILAPLFVAVGVPDGWPVQTLAFLLAFGALVLLHIILGELVPKSLAIRHAVTIVLWIGRPLRWFYRTLRPVVWFLRTSSDWILRAILKTEPASAQESLPSDEELRVMLEEGEPDAEPDSLGREILINALDLKNRVACDIMTPRGEVVYLDLEEDFDEQINLALASRHTRFPLCRGHIDEAIGLVHIKDLLALVREGKKDLGSVRRDLHHVSEMMPLEKLLRFFLSKRAHLAIVVDEYGGALGIVTLDNVIEELVGSIHDEFDAGEETEIRKINEDEFDVDGTLPLHEVSELIDAELQNEDVSTIGGYITSSLGHIPQKGEKVTIGSFIATVVESDPRRVVRVHFLRQPSEESPQ